MSNDKGFRSMSALVDALRTAEEGLRKGTLPLTALDDAANDARELYERLIVLRHKAREATHAKPKPAPAPAPPATAKAEASALLSPAAQEPAATAKPVAASEPRPSETAKPEETKPSPAPPAAAPIRLNTRPAEPEPAEAEEPVHVMKTAAEYLKDAQAAKAQPAKAPAARPAESVAEKLERARIADLSKAISLSDKFWFTKELFAGDAKAYEVGVSLLNSAKDRDEAQGFLQEELLTKLKSPPDAEALEAFTELIERRFA